jgi:hypothetical protein
MLATLALLTVATARDLELRAYLHDPVHPLAQPFQLKNKGGTATAIEWRAEGLTAPVKTTVVDNRLAIHADTGAIAAEAAVPEGLTQVIVVLTPRPAGGEGTPYQMILLDGSPRAFPFGTSKAVSYLGIETAIEAGEHRLRLPAGKISQVPAVKKRDEFNMAQVNFYLHDSETLVPFTERRLRFVDEIRRIFLVYATPGSQQPTVTTLVDYQPRTEPGKPRKP